MKPTDYNDDFFDDDDVIIESEENDDPPTDTSADEYNIYFSLWVTTDKLDTLKKRINYIDENSDNIDYSIVENANINKQDKIFIQIEIKLQQLNVKILPRLIERAAVEGSDCAIMFGNCDNTRRFYSYPYIIGPSKKDKIKILSETFTNVKPLKLFPLPIPKDSIIYKKRKLLIRNIDSQRIISNKEINYIEDVFSKCVSPFLNVPEPIDPLYNYIRDNETAPHIPILLVEKTPSYEELWKELIIDETLKKYIPTGKVLGYYAKSDGDICKGPHIALCPEEIEKAAKNAKISFELLFSKVLIHELTHVLMDKFEIDKHSKAINISTKTLYSKAMEESLANMITLQCFKKYDKVFGFEAVKNFIRKQPIIYQFGINQFDIDADWTKWRDSDKNRPELKTWFETCFKTDGTAEIRDDLVYTKEIYNAVFK